jgi:hypothetical protein
VSNENFDLAALMGQRRGQAAHLGLQRVKLSGKLEETLD